MDPRSDQNASAALGGEAAIMAALEGAEDFQPASAEQGSQKTEVQAADSQTKRDGREVQAAKINAIIDSLDKYWDPEGKRSYIALPGSHVLLDVYGGDFGRHLTRFLTSSKTPLVHESTKKQIADRLDSDCQFDGNEIEPMVRFGFNRGGAYIDRGTNDDRYFHLVPSEGVVECRGDCPVKFVRTGDQLPYPELERISNFSNSSGRLYDFWKEKFDEIHPLEDAIAIRILVFICATLVGNNAVLVLTGEQGSGKSTLSKRVKLLIDPGTSAQALPAEEKELVSVSESQGVVNWDNLTATRITEPVSNLFCSFVTGVAVPRKQLYRTNEILKIKLKRSIVLNGIGDLVSHRADLLRRSDVIRLPKIGGSGVNSRDLDQAFEDVRPCLTWMHMEIAARALGDIKPVDLRGEATQVDYAEFGAAVARAVGLSEDEFLLPFLNQFAEQNAFSIESEPFLRRLATVAEEQVEWVGSIDQLKALVLAGLSDEERRKREFDKTGRQISSLIDRKSVALRQVGVQLERLRGRTDFKDASGKRVQHQMWELKFESSQGDFVDAQGAGAIKS